MKDLRDHACGPRTIRAEIFYCLADLRTLFSKFIEVSVEREGGDDG